MTTVTGCSSGLGLAIAKHVLSQHHRLAATARTISTLSYLPDDDQSVLKLALDVTSRPSIEAALSATLSHFGRVDVVVNNAGINTFGHAEALSEQTMRDMMETNFWGPMHLTRLAIAAFREANPKTGKIGGTVVNVSSIGGRVAFPNHAGYHASKFALEGFSEAITTELDPKWGIKVMILEPGGTKSSFATASAAPEGAPRHSAYGDEELPVNVMLKALMDPKLTEGHVEAEKVAECLFQVLDGERELPMRLPTGRDAFAAIRGKEELKVEELERWKEVSESVGGGVVPG